MDNIIDEQANAIQNRSENIEKSSEEEQLHVQQQVKRMNLLSDIPTASAALTMDDDDFLARVNLNEKIKNILRSPREKSLYTTIAPSSSTSRFNLAAAPFVSQQKQQLQHQQHHSSRQPITADKNVANNIAYGVTCKDSATSLRQLPISAGHLNAPSLHYCGCYEAPGRNSNYCHSRHTMPPTQLPQQSSLSTTMYAQETSMHHRKPAGVSPLNCAQQFPQPMPPPPHMPVRPSTSGNRIALQYTDPIRSPCSRSAPIAMVNGTIQLRMRHGIRIDMTLDKAVRVLNERSMVAIALSRNCSNSALIHPNGRVLQSGSKVEIVAFDGMKTNDFIRYAKMWYRGVSFTSESCALVYLVDSAGTRTTRDSFTDMTKDYTLAVFYEDSRHGPSYVQDANEIIANSVYSCSDEGTEIYDLNGFRITQAADGLVKVIRSHNKCLIRTSPTNGSATLTTPSMHCTASLGQTSHLFVRRNEKRIHFDGASFIVRNAGHSAGFNENNLLIVY